MGKFLKDKKRNHANSFNSNHYSAINISRSNY